MGAFQDGFDEGYVCAVGRIERGDHAARMCVSEYFWAYSFRFDLRDATRGEQDAVRVCFLAQRLELDGFTDQHIAIVELVLGRKTAARHEFESAVV